MRDLLPGDAPPSSYQSLIKYIPELKNHLKEKLKKYE